jgi:hypothetical protein
VQREEGFIFSWRSVLVEEPFWLSTKTAHFSSSREPEEKFFLTSR